MIKSNVSNQPVSRNIALVLHLFSFVDACIFFLFFFSSFINIHSINPISLSPLGGQLIFIILLNNFIFWNIMFLFKLDSSCFLLLVNFALYCFFFNQSGNIQYYKWKTHVKLNLLTFLLKLFLPCSIFLNTFKKAYIWALREDL